MGRARRARRTTRSSRSSLRGATARVRATDRRQVPVPFASNAEADR